MNRVLQLLLATLLLLSGGSVWAAPGETAPDLTNSVVGYFSLFLFFLAYAMVMAEEFTHLRKSKPVIFAAGVIWALVAYAYTTLGDTTTVEEAIRQNLLEYAELFFFLLTAMTYINSMTERKVFDALKAWLIRKGFTYRQMFWITGTLAFLISPVADNLTTALLMSAVLLAVGKQNPRFVSLGCINIVIGANAGGAFSPFGDITTLMVWQKGMVHFWTFFTLFIPAAVNFLVPGILMHFAVPKGRPDASDETIKMLYGAKAIMFLFLLTIITAVAGHNYLNLPPVIGMMTGLSYLMFYGYYLKIRQLGPVAHQHRKDYFDVFNKVSRAEWDTLLFFYGVVLCVGALGQIGYLALTSEFMYTQLGATTANTLVGVISSVVDNIPVMYAVLTMNPDMSTGQWLLVTLTAGVGGSMLSIGSAAGVALMGQARGIYTFFSHLKWLPAIAIGYAASILVHMLVNARYF
ncbi:MAG TPA: sodium:proton antiporter [Gammaproteobacteria bacterium]|nr:sodium:proton antiporter [Gammaproteobacteria bacterium]